MPNDPLTLWTCLIDPVVVIYILLPWLVLAKNLAISFLFLI